MAQRNRLTNNSDETDIASLMSGDSIFAIPYFQRPYRWKPERLRQLQSDILSLVDEESDNHFLGAVIVHGRRSNPSAPNVYEVIDGQQRITTLFLLLCATVKVLAAENQVSEAAALFQKFLAINRDTRPTSNVKLQSCKQDRRQLMDVFDDLLKHDQLRSALGSVAVFPLPRTGSDTGAIANNYRACVRFLEGESKQGGLDRVRAIYSALLERISVVQIDVWDPTNGPKIFDSLNSRQEPMTVGDLIRNEIFSRVSNEDAATIEQVDSEYWQPFYKRFEQDSKNHFDEYFFPFGLVKRPNLRKSEVYATLRAEWEQLREPRLIIDQLAEYQGEFLNLKTGTNHSNLPTGAFAALKRLFEVRAPSSTFPFLMRLCKSTSNGDVKVETAVEILDVIETFLVRRAVCGYEPTGLHAVFKRLWSDCSGEVTPQRVTKEISKHKTVV